MKTSRRILLMALVLLLALLVPLGAAGAKSKPDPNPFQYENVTIELVGAEGLATSCESVGPIKMQRGPGPTGTRYIAAEGYGESESPILQIEAAVPWSRVYPLPYGLTGDSLTGCHGVFDPDGDGGESVPFSPLLMIDTDRDGKPVSLAWHFDRYAVEETRGHNTLVRMLEGFDLISDEGFTCVGGNPYSCSGTFTLQSFLSGPFTGDQPDVHGYPNFAFTIQFTSP